MTSGMEFEHPEGGDRSEFALVSALSFLLSIIAFLFFYRRGDILLYGDAVAHLNIARRITDSRAPGLDQLGSVWLPLPHLLVAPFVAIDWLWRTGIGASIPSMCAYVLGVTGLYRLVRARATATSAAFAAASFALNPSLLYMQSTAMTETIFFAALIWSVVYFDEYLRGLFPELPGAAASLPGWRALERCGLALGAAIFTRYDGWIFAFIVGVSATLAALNWWRLHPSEREVGRMVRSMLAFLLFLALCPSLWLAHCYKQTGNPLTWMNGPYSAKAIEARSHAAGEPPYPGEHDLRTATQYFLKAARMNTGEGAPEKWLILLATAGVLVAAFDLRRFGPWLLLWIPLPFYAYSVAYGAVPIFLPEWWPYSYYNVRYGLELLPAIAVFAALLPWLASRLRRPALTATVAIALSTLTIMAFASSAHSISKSSRGRDFGHSTMIPLCYREAWVNSRGRMQLESQLAHALASLPKNATLLMYTGDYPGAIQQAGIPFRRVINEGTWLTWDAAHSSPAAVAAYVVAVEGDPVAEAVKSNPRGLVRLATFHSDGRPDVTIYRGER